MVAVFGNARGIKTTLEMQQQQVEEGCTHVETRMAASEPTCPVCFEASTDVLEECGHTLCRACARRWFTNRPTCPMCRAPITTGSSPAIALGAPLASLPPLPRSYWPETTGPLPLYTQAHTIERQLYDVHSFGRFHDPLRRWRHNLEWAHGDAYSG